MTIRFQLTDADHNQPDDVTAEEWRKFYDKNADHLPATMRVEFSKAGAVTGLILIDETGEYTSAETVEEETETVKRLWPEMRALIVEQYGADDKIALNTGFNDWTDSLCKDGTISERTYNEITREDVD